MPRFTLSLPAEFGSDGGESTEGGRTNRSYDTRRAFAADEPEEPPIARWLATWARSGSADA